MLKYLVDQRRHGSRPAGRRRPTRTRAKLILEGLEDRTLLSSPALIPPNSQNIGLAAATALAFSELPSPTITAGTAEVQVFGLLRGSGQSPFAPAGETVSASVGGVTTSGTLDAHGDFLITLPTASLTAASSPYTITYSYTGDGNFAPATGTSTLTVDSALRATASFADLSAPTITYGTASQTISGHLNAVPQNTNVFQPADSTWAPIGQDGTAFGRPNLPSLILTVNPDGSVTVTRTANFHVQYDGNEDIYIGIVNPAGSGVVLNSLTLAGLSGANIFAFENDGIQTSPFSTPSNYTLPPAAFSYYDSTIYPNYEPPGTPDNPNGGTGYEGPGTYFSGIDLNPISPTYRNLGTVNFDDGTGLGLMPGEQTFFSLEGTPSGVTGVADSVPPAAAVNLAGEPVQVALNGVAKTATLDANGEFSTVFNTGSLGVAGSPYPIAFSFGGDSQIEPATGSSTLTVVRATPSFSNLSAPPITFGVATATVSGHLSPNAGGQPVPAGELVAVTLNGVKQDAALDGNDDFFTTFQASALGVAGSPYTVGFHYAGDGNFAAASATTPLTVGRATPLVVWATPADIPFGTPLGSGQLNAVAEDPTTLASLAGTFSYDPAAGTVLGAGGHTVTVTFTPADSADYTTAGGSVTLQVELVRPTFSNLSAPPITFGAATATVSGHLDANANGQAVPAGELVAVTLNGVAQDVPLDGSDDFTATFQAAALGAAGSPYTVDFRYDGDANFGGASGRTALTVRRVPLTIIDLTSPVIAQGTSAVQVFGQLTESGIPDSPPPGETVTATVGGVSASGALDANGNFLITLPTALLAASGSPYTISYAYAGDGNFAPASATSTLTVNPVAASTASFTNLSAPTITYGTGSTTVSGHLAASPPPQGSGVFQPAGSPWAPVGADSTAFGNANLPAIILTVNGDGSITVTRTANFNVPFDGSEDNYVGVVNPAGSGVVLGTLTLTGAGGAEIFGFDGDGIQSPGFATPASYTLPPAAFSYYDSTIYPLFGAPGSAGNPNGGTGYEGPGTFFTGIDLDPQSPTYLNAGTVHFDDGTGLGLLPGQQTFFSLEGLASGITGGTGSLAGTMPAVPAGELVLVTLNGVTQTATLDANDNFSTTFATGALGVAGSPYPIGFSYAGDGHFGPATGGSTLTVLPATPTFTGFSNLSITVGTATAVVLGHVSVDAGGHPVPPGETVQVTLAGVTIAATLDANDNFTATFDTRGLVASATPYAITFNFAGDANFAAATAGTALAVQPGAPVNQSALAIALTSVSTPQHASIPLPIRFLEVSTGLPLSAALRDAPGGLERPGQTLDAIAISSGTSGVGQISGRIFDDLNGSGASDASKPGLLGVPVFLDLNNNGILDPGEPETKTNANGEYAFSGLPLGSYVIRQAMPGSVVQTMPPNDAPYQVLLRHSGESYITDRNFGLQFLNNRGSPVGTPPKRLAPTPVKTSPTTTNPVPTPGGGGDAPDADSSDGEPDAD
jgi:hypothetical protein